MIAFFQCSQPCFRSRCKNVLENAILIKFLNDSFLQYTIGGKAVKKNSALLEAIRYFYQLYFAKPQDFHPAAL